MKKRSPVRRFFTLTLAVVLTVGLAACSSSSKPASPATTPTTSTSAASGPCGKAPIPAAAADFKPVVAGTLSVVTSLPGPGFWEGSDTDPTKLTSGYEYDIAKCMEQAFGLSKMTVRNVSFDAIEAGTVTNFDVILSQISITPERAKVMTFSEPYFESQQGVLMRSGETIGTLADAKLVNWGVQTGTTAVNLLDKIGAKNRHTYQSLADAYTALQAKQVTAVLIDTAINLGEAARSNGAFHVVAQFDQPGGPDRYGAALPKGSKNLTAVNAVFKSLKESGELDKLVIKDLTADPGTIPVIKVPAGK
jgi:polar amino acid transport system substrate-binding protein